MWTHWKDKCIAGCYGVLGLGEIGKALGTTAHAVQRRINQMKIKPNGDYEYSVYLGDEQLYTGSKQYIMDDLGIGSKQFNFLTTSTHTNRMERDNNYVIVRLGKWAYDEGLFYKCLEEMGLEHELHRWGARPQNDFN